MTISASQWHCEVDIIVEVDAKIKKYNLCQRHQNLCKHESNPSVNDK
jgi:hypothetical protein